MLLCPPLRSPAHEPLIEPPRHFGWKNQPEKYCHTVAGTYIDAPTRQPNQPKNISRLMPLRQYAHSLQQLKRVLGVPLRSTSPAP